MPLTTLHAVDTRTNVVKLDARTETWILAYMEGGEVRIAGEAKDLVAMLALIQHLAKSNAKTIWERIRQQAASHTGH